MPDSIELQHVSFCYPCAGGNPVQALQDIQLEIQEGEFIALIGQNGSGKSTLARMLNALLLPDEGWVRVFGLDTRAGEHHAVIRAQVGMVFQHPQEQIVGLTVEEDVAFGPANLGMPPQEIRRRVDESLAAVGLEAMAERLSYLLSAGETQQLALASVLAVQPRCVIFDEATAMLDPQGREMVLEQARQLNRQGITILLITHLMEEAAHAERIIALHKGRVALDGPAEQVLTSAKHLREIGLDIPAAAQAARSLRSVLPGIPLGIWQEETLMNALPRYDGRLLRRTRPGMQESTKHLVVVDELAHTYMRATPLAHRALDGLSLKVDKGSVHGIIGATGCGKSTLLQHVNALLRPQSGRVESCGLDLSDPHLDTCALRRQVALAFQQPEDQFFETLVGDEIAYGPKNLLDNPNLTHLVNTAMRAVGLDFAAYKDRRIAELSGGEKRKVALASVLASQPRLLLLDEPLAGLDPRSRADIAANLQELNRQGMTLLVATHQFEGLIEMMEAVSIIKDGHDLRHGRPMEVFSEECNLPAAHLIPPLAVKVSLALRDKGWPLPYVAVSLADLIEILGGQKEQGGL